MYLGFTMSLRKMAMETQQEGSLKPAEYLDIYQCAAKSAAAEKSVLRRKICVVVLFLTMLPYNDVFPPSCFGFEFSPERKFTLFFDVEMEKCQNTDKSVSP